MLVDYPDSDTDADSEQSSTTTEKNSVSRKRKAAEDPELQVKAKQAPRLPPSFHSLYATNVRTAATDDPALHAGRTRQIPHIAGNWPTHIYLEWSPSKAEVAALDNVLEQAKEALGPGSGSGSGCITGIRKSTPTTPGAQLQPEAQAQEQAQFQPQVQLQRQPQLHSLLRSELGALLPLHVSLSAPVVLKTEQKTAFQESLLNKLSKCHLKPFTVQTTGLDWVANHDRSRFFLVLRLAKPENDELNRLLSACNAVARQFGLATLYEDAEERHGRRKSDNSDAFHISIAWALQLPTDQVQEQKFGELDLKELRALGVKFDQIKLKIGSSVIDVPFTKR